MISFLILFEEFLSNDYTIIDYIKTDGSKIEFLLILKC